MTAMKLVSWNVNGLRACMGKGFEEFLRAEAPDVICLQETKMQREQADFQFDGYHEYWNSAVKKGYSGTAMFSRTEPISVRYGISGGAGDAAQDTPWYDEEGRAITAEFPDFYLVTVYTPNSQRDLVRIAARMEWEDAFRPYLLGLMEKKPVIVCGDMNVAHRPIDLKNPKNNIGNAGYSYEERGKFGELLACGLLDTFRHFYPDEAFAYSWWSYMYNSRQNNTGWRIDYFLADERLKDRLEDSRILSDVLGSDHCPVELLIRN